MVTFQGWIWLGFVVLFVVVPIVYGAGYRRWGLPYPRYFQRLRGTRVIFGGGGSLTSDHRAWGLRGDAVWLAIVVGAVWAFFVTWPH